MSGPLVRLAVVVTSWNTTKLLDACLRSLAGARGEPTEPLYPLCRSFGAFLLS